MWTARLRDAKLINGKWNVAIIYLLDGTETHVRDYTFDSIDAAAIRAMVRGIVAKLNLASSEVPVLVEGADIDLTAPTPAPTPTPTAAEIARSDWFTKWEALQKLIRLSQHGLLPLTDIRIANLQATLTSTWLNSYMDGV